MSAKFANNLVILYEEDDSENDQIVPVLHHKPTKHHQHSRYSTATVPDHLQPDYDAWLHNQSDPELYTSRRGATRCSTTSSDRETTETYIAAGPLSQDSYADKSRAYTKRRNDLLHRKETARLHRQVLGDQEVFLASQHARGDHGRDTEFVRRKQGEKALRKKGRNDQTNMDKFRMELERN